MNTTTDDERYQECLRIEAWERQGGWRGALIWLLGVFSAGVLLALLALQITALSRKEIAAFSDCAAPTAWFNTLSEIALWLAAIGLAVFVAMWRGDWRERQ